MFVMFELFGVSHARFTLYALLHSVSFIMFSSFSIASFVIGCVCLHSIH
jgi:hypothetical protein